MRRKEWLTLAYFLGMMTLVMSGKLIKANEWRSMMGIEIIRSFTYTFAGSLSVRTFKGMIRGRTFFDKFCMGFFLLLCLLLISFCLRFACYSSRTYVIIFIYLNFFTGLIFTVIKSFEEANRLTELEKKGEIIFDFPFRSFARIFFALLGFVSPEIFYGLTFLLEFILIRIRVNKKSPERV